MLIVLFHFVFMQQNTSDTQSWNKSLVTCKNHWQSLFIQKTDQLDMVEQTYKHFSDEVRHLHKTKLIRYSINKQTESMLNIRVKPNISIPLCSSYCDTVLAFRCVGVCTPVREFLCLLLRETHTKGLRARSPARPEVEEGKNVPEKTESQLTKGGWREQSAWDSSPGKDTVDSEKMDVGQRREWTEVRKTAAKTCWPTAAGLTNARRR